MAQTLVLERRIPFGRLKSMAKAGLIRFGLWLRRQSPGGRRTPHICLPVSAPKFVNLWATNMPDIHPDNRHIKRGRMRAPMRDRNPERMAETMIQIFGSASAAGQAIEMVRMQTNAGNRDAAVKWHHIMRLIEETGRKQR
jgi:hypothetical protein